MAAREGGLILTEEIYAAKRRIIGENPEAPEGSWRQSNVPAEHVSIDIEQAVGCSCATTNEEFLKSIVNAGSDNNNLLGPKIPKVANVLRDIESNKGCYDPVVVSIGPYHHEKSSLLVNEKLKLKWANQFVADIFPDKEQIKTPGLLEKKVNEVYKEVENVADAARTYYDSDHMQEFSKEKFTKMMFLDGCFILQYIYLMIDVKRRTEIGMKNDLVAFVRRDLFLLENQLPYIVLEALMSMRFEDGHKGRTMIDNFIKQTQSRPPKPKSFIYRNFQSRCSSSKPKTSAKSSTGQAPKAPGDTKAAADRTDGRGGSAEPGEAPKSGGTNAAADTQAFPSQQVHVHLLDILRKSFVSVPVAVGGKNSISDPANSEAGTEWYSYRSAKELTTVGIRFKASESSSFRDVHFLSRFLLLGELTLPPLSVEDSTKSLLLNMVAFEMSPDGPDDFCVTSYICLMDSLLDHVEDVIELRNRDILMNYLGSDQQVADLFNDISKNLVPDPIVYREVKNRIEEHYKNRVKIWMADWLHKHFSSPWTVLAFLGAIFAITLSLIQTYFAANPPK